VHNKHAYKKLTDWINVGYLLFRIENRYLLYSISRGSRGRDRMVVGFQCLSPLIL